MTWQSLSTAYRLPWSILAFAPDRPSGRSYSGSNGYCPCCPVLLSFLLCVRSPPVTLTWLAVTGWSGFKIILMDSGLPSVRLASVICQGCKLRKSFGPRSMTKFLQPLVVWHQEFRLLEKSWEAFRAEDSIVAVEDYSRHPNGALWALGYKLGGVHVHLYHLTLALEDYPKSRQHSCALSTTKKGLWQRRPAADGLPSSSVGLLNSSFYPSAFPISPGGRVNS